MLKMPVIKQLQQHSVAIVSLMTALAGFFYNTWQDHENELHLNMRQAAFEVLRDLGELQTIVNYAHYEMEVEHGNPIDGWKYVLLVKDLSHLLPARNMHSSQQLFDTWSESWSLLSTNAQSEQKVSAMIAKVRSDVLVTIDELQ